MSSPPTLSSMLRAGGVLTARVAVLLVPGAILLERTLSASSSGDYLIGAPVAGDNAGPALDALSHGQFASMAAHQPLMGLSSIVLRAPFAAAATLMGARGPVVYATGALVCILPLLVLATWMTVRHAEPVTRPLAGAVGAAILLAAPATWEAVNSGHAEELLAAALATGAVLTATRAHERSTWVLLGLAMGTKQWALIALPCVIVALPARRLAVSVKACALGAALSAALPLADPRAFADANAAVGGVHIANQLSIWWPLGSPITALHGATVLPTAHVLPLGLTRSVAGVLAMSVALAGIWIYAHRARTRGTDALALLALLGLVRCVSDPGPLQYYFVALLIPLAVWESVELGRLPVVTAIAVGAVAFVARGSFAAVGAREPIISAGLQNALSVAGALSLGCYLAYRAFHVNRRARSITLEFPAYGPIKGGI